MWTDGEVHLQAQGWGWDGRKASANTLLCVLHPPCCTARLPSSHPQDFHCVCPPTESYGTPAATVPVAVTVPVATTPTPAPLPPVVTPSQASAAANAAAGAGAGGK